MSGRNHKGEDAAAARSRGLWELTLAITRDPEAVKLTETECQALLARLADGKLREILRLRYAQEDGTFWNLTACSRRYRVTPERIRQQEFKALKLLRMFLRPYPEGHSEGLKRRAGWPQTPWERVMSWHGPKPGGSENALL